MAKTITVVLESGDLVEASWSDERDGTIYVYGTEIGKAKTAKDAIAIVETYAERKKGSRVKRVSIS